MATFAFKPYTYVPTPPRSKSTSTRHKPAPEQVSILDKLQQIKSSSASLSTSRPAAAAAAVADGDGGYKPGIRGTGSIYGRSDKENNDENDDDRDLPTIEELLLAKLQEQGFATEDRGPDKTGGVEEAAADEMGGSIDESRSAQSDNSSRNPEDPIGDSSASKAEVNDVSLRAESAAAPGMGLFDSPETAFDSTTPAPPCSSDGWHDIDDFPETAPCSQLAEQGASTSTSVHPHTPSSRLSSEPLHDSIGAVDLHPRPAGSEATTSSSARPQSPPSRCARALPENQLSQEGRLDTGRRVADEHELVGPAHNADPVDERERRQQRQQRQQQQDEDNEEDTSSKNEHWEADSMAPMQLKVWPRASADWGTKTLVDDQPEGLQQEVKGVAAEPTAKRVGDTHLSGKADGSPRPAERQELLPDREPLPATSHDEAGCGSHSGGELNNTKSDKDDEEPRPMKRKRPSSSQDGPMHKKPKPRLQQRSIGQHRRRSKPHGPSPKSHSPLDQARRVAAVPRPQARPSAPHATDTDMSSDCCNLDRSSGAALPTLTEVTFRPHSAHCYSFTAVIRDGCAERGVSFSQVARLIASTGHVGKIADFSIKPMEQNSFLVTGISRYASSQPSSGGGTVSSAVDAGALASRRSGPPSSNDESGLSGSNSESGSDDDECSSEGEQGRSSTRKKRRWPELDEQRLLAYKKEGKSWKWIFRKFPGRTQPAISMRWSMIRPRGE